MGKHQMQLEDTGRACTGRGPQGDIRHILTQKVAEMILLWRCGGGKLVVTAIRAAEETSKGPEGREQAQACKVLGWSPSAWC